MIFASFYVGGAGAREEREKPKQTKQNPRKDPSHI
jgi:hypothetical protein